MHARTDSAPLQPEPAQAPGDVEPRLQSAATGFRTLVDPEARNAFRERRRQARSNPEGASAMELRSPGDAGLAKLFERRRSHSIFSKTPISLTRLSGLLARLRPSDRKSPLQSIRIFLHARADRIEDLEPGAYAYDPDSHSLTRVGPGDEIRREIHFLYNRQLFDEAAFSLFLVLDGEAKSRDGRAMGYFGLIEAGRVSHALEEAAPDVELGLCQIAGFQSASLKQALGLRGGQRVLHSLLGGAVETREGSGSGRPVRERGGWIRELRNHVAGELPEYMVPSAFVSLDALPLTPNGKIDRKALPDPAPLPGAEKATHVPPQNEIQRRLVDVFAKVLEVEPDAIGVESDLLELGMDSLALIRVQNRLMQLGEQQNFPVERLGLEDLIQCTNIASLAEVLAHKVAEEPRTDDDGRLPAGARSVEGLRPEAVLDSSLRFEGPFPSVGDPGAVLLTGATGFLGAFLLAELLRQTEAEVFCLARAGDSHEARERIVQNLRFFGLTGQLQLDRIVPVAGDLGRDDLGLSSDDYAVLAERVDLILHNGAWVNWLLPFGTLKSSNVDGVRHVLKLAATGRSTRFHFVSTTRVFPLGRAIRGALDETANPDRDGFLVEGYSQSKWVAERLVEEARSRGLPASIYRVGGIAGDSRSGIGKTRGDLMAGLINSSARVGMWPALEFSVDVLPVDYVGRAIVDLLRRQEPAVFHLINPRPLRLRDYAEFLCSYGFPVELVDYERWRDEVLRVRSGLDDDVLQPLLRRFQGSLAPDMLAPQLVGSRTEELLQGRVGCPTMDQLLFHRYLQFLVQSGALEPPQNR